jgi:Lar family restriction alleviation protein
MFEMKELKPCPFCGSYAVRIAKDKVPDGGYIYDAHCTNCGCGSPFRCTKEEVIEAWNRRTNDEMES